MSKLTKQQFIIDAINKHGDKFDYSLLPNSMNRTEKVNIICKEHGNFLQDYRDHIKSIFGCSKCATIAIHNNQRKSSSDFIGRAIKVHGDYYDYSKVDYKKNNKPVIIICPIHGEFSQLPINHLKSQYQLACLKCSDIEKGKRKANKSDISFISKAMAVHGDKYDYSKVTYVSAIDKVIIICPKHGEFLQRPIEHFSYGCQRCGIEIATEKSMHSNESILNKFKEIHGDRYDYSLVEYTGYTNKVKIICKVHGEFSQLPSSHISQESGCPHCYSVCSRGEEELQQFIQSLGLNYMINDRSLIAPKEIDVIIPDKNLAIEYNGVYWHTEKQLCDIEYHLNKTLACEKKGYSLLHVWEDDWVNKKEIIKSLIKNRLGIISRTIYGRKTIIKEITYSQAEVFLNNNHIQGASSGSIYLGLFLGEELVTVSVFSIYKDCLRLDRHACLLNTKVLGALGKVVKYISSTFNKKIITFCDIAMYTGKSYEAVGFKKDKLLLPDYSYVVNGKRVHKFNFRKKIFANKYKLNIENKTEEVLRKELKLEKIYDCGKIRYIYNQFKEVDL